ncbi:hypothetical protein JOC85_003596 [Bacillus mesophilus]|uniref:Uncharacterized protein n=1 Tax=Bacillus mesophilus TaxID=1808955 RepID=A0A6M0QEV3_9BACI|nr:hypothetical protein [Bacillus mesophilus]MBM7662785.1 hypothetical protein [Bacillus mesophilus]NEY74250.1 hypothetical protein [Bacillus mesophilus]
MLVKELYQDSLEYEESSLAHYIHHLLAEGKLSLTDDVSKVDLNQADYQKVKESIQNNLLGINPVHIFSLKKNADDFVFIFAHSPEEAVTFYTNKFGYRPINCHEYSLEFEMVRGKVSVTFREMRKEFSSFPAVAGYYRKMEAKASLV